MSSVDSIWADMQQAEAATSKAPRSKVGYVSEATTGVQKAPKATKKTKKKTDGNAKKRAESLADKPDSKSDVINAILHGKRPEAEEKALPPAPALVIWESHGGGAGGAVPTSEELVAKLGRPIQQSADPSVGVRRAALQAMTDLFLGPVGSQLPAATLADCFDELSKPLLKRFGDSAERCRILSVGLVLFFLERCKNLTRVMAYLWPAVMRRLAGAHAYDPETSIFVHDQAAHEAWKRGVAVKRQDFGQLTEGAHAVVEPSEECRLAVLRLVSVGLVDTLLARETTPLLHPYFHDLILFLQAHLRDPYPEVKVEACRVLTVLARSPALNQGMIYYALPLARAALPVLRHRHARVRAAAVQLVRAACAVPYKAKCRGAGTDAIVDLIGYTAEDTIPVTAFYGGHTTINYLAELTVDPVQSVRYETAAMLAEFITTLPDRYDHRTRIVAYVLNALNDKDPAVVAVAMEALAVAGAEFERENPDDVIERRQYGVDGDRRSNHSTGRPLPAPFVDRPRIGVRLYVKGCVRRFMKPLVAELTNWRSEARHASAVLFRTCIVFTEESLTQELHLLAPELCRAFKCFAAEGKSADDVAAVLRDCCELMGRFVAEIWRWRWDLCSVVSVEWSRLPTQRHHVCARWLVWNGATCPPRDTTFVPPAGSYALKATSLVLLVSPRQVHCARLVRGLSPSAAARGA